MLDGRSDLYSLGVVAYEMLTGELPFQAPTVPGLLMKQISTPATPVDRLRPETPRELALTVMRCLEKDPEDRWPSADALRRALETGAYSAPAPRPAARAPAPDARDRLGARLGEEVRRKALERVDRIGSRAARRAERLESRLDRKAREDAEVVRRAEAAGEPVMVARLRHRAATYASINGMLLLLNVVTNGLHTPWFLLPAVFMGFGLARDYARVWTAGYSWRDVIHRPPAPDALEAKEERDSLRSAAPEELGPHSAPIEQARSDRAAILAMLERLPKSERKMLPDIAPTVDQLLERASDLARTLYALERDIDTAAVDKVEVRIAALEQEPPSADRDRRMGLLVRQRQTMTDLLTRRTALGSQLESCLLAMQNVRFDLLRLRSAGVAEALDDLTQATQQARALSRDVDAAVSAAGEIRRLTGQETGSQPV